jgi:DNA-binding transcriptional ArsR family regulator
MMKECKMHNRHAALLNTDALPEDLLDDVVEIFKALSDSTRAQLIYLLTRREYNVNEISQYVAVSPSAVSHHLAKLRAARLVRTRREGSLLLDERAACPSQIGIEIGTCTDAPGRRME